MARTFVHTYTLIDGADSVGVVRTIELGASEPFGAMLVVQRELPDREVQLLEDGRSLGNLRFTPGGYWVVLASGRASRGV